jgi:hypothetical protein
MVLNVTCALVVSHGLCHLACFFDGVCNINVICQQASKYLCGNTD